MLLKKGLNKMKYNGLKIEETDDEFRATSKNGKVTVVAGDLKTLKTILESAEANIGQRRAESAAKGCGKRSRRNRNRA